MTRADADNDIPYLYDESSGFLVGRLGFLKNLATRFVRIIQNLEDIEGIGKK